MSTLLRSHRNQQLPVCTEYRRVVVRRRHVFEDALHCFKFGLDVTKHLRVTFVGEPAVDEGDPLRKFLFLLVGKIARNNSLFCGEETNRIPMHNMVELGKRSFYYIGVMLAIYYYAWLCPFVCSCVRLCVRTCEKRKPHARAPGCTFDL